MQGMLDVLADAGTKSEIKVTAGVTLMDMLLKDAQLEEHEARVAAYNKLTAEQGLQRKDFIQDRVEGYVSGPVFKNGGIG